MIYVEYIIYSIKLFPECPEYPPTPSSTIIAAGIIKRFVTGNLPAFTRCGFDKYIEKLRGVKTESTGILIVTV